VAIFPPTNFQISEPFIAGRHSICAVPTALRGPERFGHPSRLGSSLALETSYKRWKLPSHRLSNAHRRWRSPYLRLLGRAAVADSCAFRYQGVLSARAFAMQLEITARHDFFHVFDATLKTHAMFRIPRVFRYPFLRRKLAREGNLSSVPPHSFRQKVSWNRVSRVVGTHTHYIGVDCPTHIRPLRANLRGNTADPAHVSCGDVWWR